jgi:hypothetical protein
LRTQHTHASCSQHVPFMYSLRIRNFFFFFDPCSTICALRATRAARAKHLRIALVAAAPPCSIHVLSRFALVLPLRAMPTPTPITCADCPNECLYQLGSHSVQPCGRQRWICSAGRTFAHSRSPTLVNCANCPNECLYQCGPRSVHPFRRQRWICRVARTFARVALT